ncbi:MAG TPA: Hsp33 family molecular chaperone HslO [Candidatus Gallacutalibacter stercoravium]|nr:Hsp33 family molecular chaperone HslO [Candidatus Gallacutalibacter stercoravium]
MDRMIRCISADGSVMACAVDVSDMAFTAQKVHEATPVAAAALGRLLAAGSMMGGMLKQKEASLTLRVDGGGPIGQVVVVANSAGNCRGYVTNPSVRVPNRADGKLNVGGAVGQNGLLYVMRDYGTGEPYVGQIPLVSGEIAEDITSYYAVSEQIPTVCALGVLVDKESAGVLLAGGLLIQLLPAADDDVARRVEENTALLEPVTTMLAKGMTLEDMCALALRGFEMQKLDEFPVAYTCTCSKERTLRMLSTLSKEDILSLRDEKGYAEAKCNFCAKAYHISNEELEKLAQEKI